ncbi:MAG: serine/threonine protein kinase, partial [Bdellovibrionales bacterium]|nr:serine/threonine protein kinase [Bdellovibrionales bacterium]
MLEKLGPYQLDKQLGQGATARVYAALDTRTNTRVALKVFHPGFWNAGDFRRRALTEFKTVSSLSHPNIVPVVDSLFDSDPPAVAMELIDGVSLEAFQPRLPYVLPEVSVFIVVEILKALEFAHARGIVHRDLKPANILMGHDGRVLVSDFGHAKITDASQLTATGTVVGSPDYMAPEQAQGERATAQSDLFSAASILYFLVTGTRPFSRHSPLATLASVVAANYEPAQKRNPKLSPALISILDRALMKSPEARYASAAEFRQALEAYLANLNLTGESFSFRAWIEAPHETTLGVMQTVADALSTQCRKDIARGNRNEALAALSHLSLVAPESAYLPGLMESFRLATKQSKRRRAVWPLAILLMGGLLGGWLWNGRRAHDGAAQKIARDLSPAVAPSVPAAVAVPVPVATAPLPMPVRTIPKPVAAAKARPAVGQIVRFQVPSDVRVFWNGREVDPALPLRGQRPGTYSVRLEKEGMQPLMQ